jgi:hypothetical protein
MKYMLMIYEDEAVYAAPGAMEAIIGEHMAFGQQLGDTIVGGGGLKPIATATTVRTQSGAKTLHDGPFAETKEQLGGFYLVDVPDLDAALEIARKVPLSRDGSVEVRPLIEMDGPA